MTPFSAERVAAAGRPRPRLSVRHLYVLVPLVVLAWRVVTPLRDNSFLWHVRAGTLQLDRGEVLRSDPFSFTAFGEPWRTQSWLLELGYGRLERMTGSLQWVPTMMFLVIGATLGFVALAAYRELREPARVGLVVTAVAWVGMLFVVPRPAAVSFLVLAVFVVVLGHPRRLAWTLIPLTWLWASVHGLFVVGLGLVALEALRTRSRRLLMVGIVAGATTLLTAHGVGVITILIDFFENREALSFLSEWTRPNFLSLGLAPSLLVFAGLAWGFFTHRLPWRDLVVVAPFLVLGAAQLRSVFPALIVLVPFAARPLGSVRSSPGAPRGSPLINNALAVALVALMLIGLIRPIGRASSLPSDGAVAALTQAQAFHGLSAGGLLIWSEFPNRRVFVDDRAELYGADRFRRIRDTINGDIGMELIDGYGFDQALVKTSWGLADVLVRQGWVAAYRDEDWAVFRRP